MGLSTSSSRWTLSRFHRRGLPAVGSVTFLWGTSSHSTSESPLRLAHRVKPYYLRPTAARRRRGVEGSSGQPGVPGQRLACLAVHCLLSGLGAWLSPCVQLLPSLGPAGSSQGSSI